jgi:hypothetical protein
MTHLTRKLLARFYGSLLLALPTLFILLVAG